MNLRKSGFALPLALLLAIALLGLVSVMLFSTRQQKGTHELLVDQAQALAIARGMMQIAVYKFRMLPAEFFRIQSADPAHRQVFESVWMADFNPEIAGSPASRLKDSFRNCQDLGVATFTQIHLSTPGSDYVKDLLRIVTFAVVNNQKRTLEELLEFRLTDRH